MQEVMLQKYFLEKGRKNIVKMCSKKKRFGTFGFNTLVKAESQFSLLIKFKNGEKRDDYNMHIFMGISKFITGDHQGKKGRGKSQTMSAPRILSVKLG